jgi:hypothetical protein
VATNGPIVHHPDDMSMESHGVLILTEEREETEQKKNLAAVPLCSPQIPQGLTRE